MNINMQRALLATLALSLVSATLLVRWRFDSAMQRARAQAAQSSVLLNTRCGPIEYQESGAGVPQLAVHGSGGGHDQGMAFAGALATQGIRVIAMSRFGYLRTPMPTDASAAAQADAHVCLLDALGIDKAAVIGGSAGAQYTTGRIAGAKFIGFEQGGHTWVGHDDKVLAAIARLILPSAQP